MRRIHRVPRSVAPVRAHDLEEFPVARPHPAARSAPTTRSFGLMRRTTRAVTASITAGLVASIAVVVSATPAAAADGDTAFSIAPNTGSIAGGAELTVTPLMGVTFESVSAGGTFSLAIGSDGTTYAWESDTAGRLGDGGSITNQSTPVQVAVPDGVEFTSVSAGN